VGEAQEQSVAGPDTTHAGRLKRISKLRTPIGWLGFELTPASAARTPRGAFVAVGGLSPERITREKKAAE
jgi:hypothetical protein